MRKFLAGLMVFVSLIQAQTPIIRVMQSREYKTPKTWWREPLTFNLRGYLADDTTGMSTATNASGVALYNNNFDAWRDSVMTLAVTLQDDGAEVTAFRIDLVFDNDLIDWNHDSTRVEKGSYLSSYTEGDETADADYSYEVVRYNDAGYVDSLQTAGSEISQVNDRYDWLRVTMVSHNGEEMTFGNGENVQTELVKFHFKIEDVVDDFAPRSFRVPTKYNGQTGYYTYVTDGFYATDYKLYIDGNVGTSGDGVGNGRGDITLHPKLLDVEGYFRYVQGNNFDGDNTYPYWKIRFELDQDNPQDYNSWYNIETVENESGETDEGTTDDVIGDDETTYWYGNLGTGNTGYGTLPGEGFLNVSYYDSTYTDDRGYFNIQLPRNNYYRMSFYPPNEDDDIGDHEQLDLDRYAITNINDAIASFNFQSNKFYSVLGVDTLNAVEYLIADVDGDDFFQLNDSYIIWAYVSGILDDYTHLNGLSYENWSTIDAFRDDGTDVEYEYYEDWGNQKYEFTVFWDDDLQQDTSLQFGVIEVMSPLMDEVQTGLDTLSLILTDPNTSEWMSETNPDYVLDSISYYFTGDVNTTGTKVLEGEDYAVTEIPVFGDSILADPFDEPTDGYIDVNGSTFYRWGDSPPATWANRMASRHQDVDLYLPRDSTVRVESGNQIVVPLTIEPYNGQDIAGFEFEVVFNEKELQFIDMRTDILPGPWMTYIHVHEPIGDWRRVSFGGMDYSPGNAPEQYWIDEKINGVEFIFEAAFPDAEWTAAPINFIGKYSAGDPSGRDLLVRRQSGEVLVWNKFWAFGGGEPGDDDIAYNYPNPFNHSTTFQFYMGSQEQAKIYILNSNGQYIGTLLDEVVDKGIHTFDFNNMPGAWLPEVSVYQRHMELEPGVYIFVLETKNRIRSNKFTIVK